MALLKAWASNPLLHTVVTLALDTALRKNVIQLPAGTPEASAD